MTNEQRKQRQEGIEAIAKDHMRELPSGYHEFDIFESDRKDRVNFPVLCASLADKFVGLFNPVKDVITLKKNPGYVQDYLRTVDNQIMESQRLYEEENDEELLVENGEFQFMTEVPLEQMRWKSDDPEL